MKSRYRFILEVDTPIDLELRDKLFKAIEAMVRLVIVEDCITLSAEPYGDVD